MYRIKCKIVSNLRKSPRSSDSKVEATSEKERFNSLYDGRVSSVDFYFRTSAYFARSAGK